MGEKSTGSASDTLRTKAVQKNCRKSDSTNSKYRCWQRCARGVSVVFAVVVVAVVIVVAAL
eukprot:227018-Karenia_brevis.AAC.1